MASNVFPMLSSSPPPIEDCPDDDDDDDEFGDFASTNIPFDSSFDSPIGENFKCLKKCDSRVNDVNLKADLKEFRACNRSEIDSPTSFSHNFSSPNKSNDINTTLKKCSYDQPSSISETTCFNHDELETSHNSAFEINHFSEHEFNNGSEVEFSEEPSLNISSSNKCNSESETSECCSNFSENSCYSRNEALKEDLSNGENSTDHKFCDKVNSEGTFCNIINEHLGNSSVVNEIGSSKGKLCNDFEPSSLHSRSNSSSVNECAESDNFQRIGSELSVSHNSISVTADASCSDSGSDTFNPNFDDFQETDGILKACSSDVFGKFQEKGETECFEGEKVSVVQKLTSNSNCDVSQEFRNCSNAEEENDDFADFQDFKESNNSSNDFAEFETVPFTEAEPPKHTESCEFADFEAVPFEENKVVDETDSCDFADFEGATFCSTSISERRESTSSVNVSDNQLQEKHVNKLSTVINTIFPFSLEDDEVSSDPISEILEQSVKSRRLWEKLHEVEPTPNTRFQWSLSQSFQQLLRSVNVDYHSILRTSSVPIFASGLSLLEPVKGLSNSANQESEDRNQSPRDPIPPVEFDWNSSGLVNPLDSEQAALSLMDLSFLSSTETDNTVTSSNHSFENELLKSNPIVSHSENGCKDQILEQLLSKNVCSLPISQATHRPSDLSNEATHVLDQLPDLSFMQAKVLMFPISSNT